jgi:hypothetical protein
MSTPARASSWLPPLSLLAIALLTWAISLSPWRFIPLAVTGQLALLLILVRAFCRWPDMSRWVAAMPMPHRIVFGVLIGATILGHYSFSSRTFFPFVEWHIFPAVREDDPVTCREFIATTASGKKVRLLVEQLFPSIIQLDVLDKYPPSAIDPLVHAMAKVYNEQHADDPARQVDLMLMAVKLHPSTTELRAQPSCELLKHYDVSSVR